METVEYEGKRYELVNHWSCDECDAKSVCKYPLPCYIDNCFKYQLREIKPKTVTIEGVEYELVQGIHCDGCDYHTGASGCKARNHMGTAFCTPSQNNGVNMILKRVKPAETELTGKQHGAINDAINLALRSISNVIELKKLAQNEKNKAIKANLDRLTKENEALKAENEELKSTILLHCKVIIDNNNYAEALKDENRVLGDEIIGLEKSKLVMKNIVKNNDIEIERLRKYLSDAKAEIKELKDKINGKNKIYLWFSDKPVKNSIEFDMRIEKLMSENEELKHHIRKINADTRDVASHF